MTWLPDHIWEEHRNSYYHGADPLERELMDLIAESLNDNPIETQDEEEHHHGE